MKSGSTDVRQSPAGFAAIWTAVGFLITGAVMLSGPLLLIGLILAGTWITARYLASRHLEGLSIERSLPARAWTNRRFAVEAILSNTGMTARNFIFQDPLAVGNHPPVVELESGEKTTLSYAARCSRRGQVVVENWTAQSGWPLNWFESRRSGKFSHRESNSILVLPDPWLPPRLRDHVDGLLVSASPWTGVPEPASEFRYLREFRGGDAVRKIHWPASLKTGELLVRETEPPRPLPTRYGILLHSFSPGGELVTPESFETVLRITAGLLYRFRNAGIEIVFQAFPDESARLRHREDFDRALDELALLRRKPVSELSLIESRPGAFQNCDEVFVISDCSRELWENELSAAMSVAHCVDAKSVGIGRSVTPPLSLARKLSDHSRSARRFAS
ncbi:MAG: DUF58 domain-containing protein [Verrucomicrobiales bacterium]|nr:DUF58 domain-containing protein [Verrucomicrobiales bacterium]